MKYCVLSGKISRVKQRSVYSLVMVSNDKGGPTGSLLITVRILNSTKNIETVLKH